MIAIAIPVIGSSANYLTGTVNASVTTSQGVANCVASILLTLSTSTCLQEGATVVGRVSSPFHSTSTELALLEKEPSLSGVRSTNEDPSLPARNAFSFAPRVQFDRDDFGRVRFGAAEKTNASPMLLAAAAPQFGQESEESPIPVPSETPEETTERLKHPFTLAPQRMTVHVPKDNVPLGNPVDIDVDFALGKLANLNVTQTKTVGTTHLGISQGGGSYKIVRQEGQTSTIEIVPGQLGTITLDVGAVYSDNAIAHQAITLNVVPSSKGLVRFMLDGGARADVIVMGDDEKEREKDLRPVVTYKDVQFPIFLDDPTTIKYSVEQDDSDPILRVSPDGMVHALREGVAYVVGDFDGVTDRVKFTVYSKNDAPAGFGVLPH
jgi:hypothetical protein